MSKGKRANELKVEKRKNTKASPTESMQYVSLPGRPYPNIVHNVQSPDLKQTRLPYIRHQGFAGIRDNPLSRIRQPLAGGGKLIAVC